MAMSPPKSTGASANPSSDDDRPRDRDQTPVGAARSHEVADRAEAAATRPTARGPEVGSDPLVNRDNLQGTPDRPTAPGGTPGSAGSSAADADDLRRRIAERAYEKAQRRGFSPGQEEADWLQAENEIHSEATRREP